MSTRRTRPASASEPRWLSPAEREAWLSITRLMTKLPAAMDAQLGREAGLSYFEYIVMAMLSEQADRTLRMTQLAALTNASLSRLSHVAKRLETAGYLTRQPDERDGRATKATLTDDGYATVAAAAPGHVTAVRELVFDPLTTAQVRQLRNALEDILSRVDPGGTSDPFAVVSD